MQTHRITKCPAAHLSSFPLEMIPFKPVDGPDNHYGQIYTHMRENPHSDAGIEGFNPTEPFKPFNFSIMSTLPTDEDINFLTLLNFWRNVLTGTKERNKQSWQITASMNKLKMLTLLFYPHLFCLLSPL